MTDEKTDWMAKLDEALGWAANAATPEEARSVLLAGTSDAVHRFQRTLVIPDALRALRAIVGEHDVRLGAIETQRQPISADGRQGSVQIGGESFGYTAVPYPKGATPPKLPDGAFARGVPGTISDDDTPEATEPKPQAAVDREALGQELCSDIAGLDEWVISDEHRCEQWKGAAERLYQKGFEAGQAVEHTHVPKETCDACQANVEPLSPELRERLGRAVYQARINNDTHGTYQTWESRDELGRECDRSGGEAVWRMRDAEVARLDSENFRLRAERNAALKRAEAAESNAAKLATRVTPEKLQEEYEAWKVEFDRVSAERDEAVKRADAAESNAAKLAKDFEMALRRADAVERALSKAIDERDASRRAAAAWGRDAEGYARVCSALGIEYAPDSGPTAPGPIDAVLEEIELMKKQCGELLEIKEKLRELAVR